MLLHMTGEETLGRLFEYNVELLSEVEKDRSGLEHPLGRGFTAVGSEYRAARAFSGNSNIHSYNKWLVQNRFALCTARR